MNWIEIMTLVSELISRAVLDAAQIVTSYNQDGTLKIKSVIDLVNIALENLKLKGGNYDVLIDMSISAILPAVVAGFNATGRWGHDLNIQLPPGGVDV